MQKVRFALCSSVVLIVGTAFFLLFAVDIPHANDAAMLTANLPGPFGIYGNVPASRVRIDVLLDQYLYRYELGKHTCLVSLR